MTIAQTIAKMLHLPKNACNITLHLSAASPNAIKVEVDVFYPDTEKPYKFDYRITEYAPFDLKSINTKTDKCTYPDCNCPFDMGPDGKCLIGKDRS